MPTLLRVEGFRFFFFSNEGQEPPHVHVSKAVAGPDRTRLCQRPHPGRAAAGPGGDTGARRPPCWGGALKLFAFTPPMSPRARSGFCPERPEGALMGGARS